MSRAPKTAAPETATPVPGHPNTGGSYIRQPDGTLVREGDDDNENRPGAGEAPASEES